MLDNWKLETAARAAHEANRAYCLSLGDASQQSWDTCPEWQKSSAKDGVLKVYENPSLTPEQSHKNWSDHKLADGWKYGPKKDPIAKEHPCLVPFRELPYEQQAKDIMFTEIVKAVFRALATQPQ